MVILIFYYPNLIKKILHSTKTKHVWPGIADFIPCLYRIASSVAPSGSIRPALTAEANDRNSDAGGDQLRDEPLVVARVLGVARIGEDHDMAGLLLRASELGGTGMQGLPDVDAAAARLNRLNDLL